jgi:alkylhydroperoxidase family enzyme
MRQAAASDQLLAEKISAVPEWRDEAVFTETERLVMLYAEAMTVTRRWSPMTFVYELRLHLSDAELAELTALVAAENQRSRMNVALGR